MIICLVYTIFVGNERLVMEQINQFAEYIGAIIAIKDAILQSRYRAAKLVNKEMLSLYYAVGGYISTSSRNCKWGSNAIKVISQRLQIELPGLRGFSEVNIKRMRTFYEDWRGVFENRPLTTDDSTPWNNQMILQSDTIQICPLMTDELSKEELDNFLSVGFTHHYEILIKTKSLDERMFYISKCASEFWSVKKLKYYLEDSLYKQRNSIANNFTTTIRNIDLRHRAMRSFKDEYLLDFINIEDPDDFDEHELENEIVHNIKNFIMALGSDFTFIGNQYRLIVDEQEYFVDLLFFSRRLRSLLAIELKRGDFKPEYAGKLNFYLSALDEYVKLPDENPSIGIVLCKSKSNKIVEFAFRDTDKPMGVATYRTFNELPQEYQGILPDEEELKSLF